jgi:uncharacterized damage-inducible protein DinB
MKLANPTNIFKPAFFRKFMALMTIAIFLTGTVLSQTPPNTNASFTSATMAQIKKLAAYNTWANQQLADWLSKADSTQWQLEIQSSFNTLELTLRHLWNAEYGWLTSLKNEPWGAAIEKGAKLSQSETLAGFMKTSKQLQDFIESLNDNALNESRNFGKDQRPVSVADIIQHVFNHATYHRGQLITMGRQAGLSSPPRTDYIYYITQ